MTALNVRDLTLRVGSRTLVAGADFEVSAGELVGLTGANGAGKSTLLRTLAGFDLPALGTVGFGNTVTDRRGGSRNGIGYAPSRLDAPGRLTVGEYLDMLTAARGRGPGARTVDDLVVQVGADSLLGSPIDVLSTGERKKVSVVAALMHRPALGLFDEPFEALDEDSALRVREVLGEFVAHGGAAVVCTHRHRFLRGAASRVLALTKGRLVVLDVERLSTGHDAHE